MFLIVCSAALQRKAAVSSIKFGLSRCWGFETAMDISMEWEHRWINSINLTMKQFSLRQQHVNAQKDNNVWRFRLWHASEQCIKNMYQKKLANGIRLPKRAKSLFCEGRILLKRWNENLSRQWEKYDPRESFSTVTYAVQCLRTLSAETSTLSLSSSMTILKMLCSQK